MNIVNCRPAYTYIKITKHHNFTLKKSADDYASAAELNLHEPTGAIGDGRTDILYM